MGDTKQVFLSGFGKLSDCTESVISSIDQLDGKCTNIMDYDNCTNLPPSNTQCTPPTVFKKPDKITAALSLPTVATHNLRSLFPKIENFTTDILERKIDCAFLSEIWEKEHCKEHQGEIEKLLELHGLQYMSTCRKPNAKGVSYGGAAIVVNLLR